MCHINGHFTKPLTYFYFKALGYLKNDKVHCNQLSFPPQEQLPSPPQACFTCNGDISNNSTNLSFKLLAEQKITYYHTKRLLPTENIHNDRITLYRLIKSKQNKINVQTYSLAQQQLHWQPLLTQPLPPRSLLHKILQAHSVLERGC